MKTNGVENFEKVKSTVAEWKDKPHDEQFKFCDQLGDQIRAIDRQIFDRQKDIDYSHRNTLVNIVRELRRELPFRFKVGDTVTVKFERRIKGVVKELLDPSDRSVLIKPVDNVYKETFIVPESLLEYDIAPEIQEGQLTLAL